MMEDLAILLGLVFMVVCVAFTILHSMRLGRLTLLDWAFLGMAGIYGGGWALVVFVTKRGANTDWSSWLLPFQDLYFIHTLCSMILASSIVLGWGVSGSRLRLKSRQESLRILKSIEVRLAAAMWWMLVIGISAQWLYSQAYGGLIDMLEYSSYIRSSMFDRVPPNLFSFLRPFGGLVLFASFGFFGLLLTKRRGASVFIGFVFSFPFSIYLHYSWLGRIGFLVYMATFVLGVLLYTRPRPLNLLVKGTMTMLAIVVGSYYTSIWFDVKAAENLYVFLAREISFPFVSFFAELDSGEHLFRGFRDFFVAPVYLLPSSWWLQWVESISQINTTVILGAPKGENGVTGGIPVDLLTLGLMQAWVFGVFIVGIMFGALLRLFQYLLDRLPHTGVRVVFNAYVALKIAVLGMFYAQPELFVSGNFALIAAAMIIVIFLKMPKFRWSSPRHRPESNYTCNLNGNHTLSGSSLD